MGAEEKQLKPKYLEELLHLMDKVTAATENKVIIQVQLSRSLSKTESSDIIQES